MHRFSSSHLRSIALLFIVVGLLVLVSCPMDPGNGSFLDKIPTAAEVGEPFFSVIPLDVANFDAIVPLGNLNPAGHTFPTNHHYLYLANPGTEVPIYAPGRIWVTMITSSYNHTTTNTDYGIHFYACREVRAYFGHVTALTGDVEDAFASAPADSEDTYTTGGTTYTVTDKTVFIEVTAGTPIGSTDGSTSAALDFGVFDTRVAHTFANPARFAGKDYLCAVPCLDYYTATPKTDLESVCGSFDGAQQRTAPPIGGTVAQDIPGTAQGLWFLPGEPTYPEDPHLALVHDNVDPTQPVFSVGNEDFGLTSGTYSYTPAGSGIVDREFGDITNDGQTYIIHYVGPNHPADSRTILITMPSATSLQIEAQGFDDTGPWSFQGNEVQFER
jgi:hypothetical protein